MSASAIVLPIKSLFPENFKRSTLNKRFKTDFTSDNTVVQIPSVKVPKTIAKSSKLRNAEFIEKLKTKHMLSVMLSNGDLAERELLRNYLESKGLNNTNKIEPMIIN
eukprot:TRINITY_DN1653_c0_g2_i4.p1 TRINITY_DN1653_c0_g2~~TRINITY_DN1653_c0_g2_i4.p1  ORF type:complete len:107 (+),score=18.78 TRINITY_DN1653_c0_g2_i4:161-481(+)